MNRVRLRIVPAGRGEERRERFLFLLFLSFLIHATLALLLAVAFSGKHLSPQKETPETPPPEVTLEIPPAEKRPFMEAKKVADNAPEKPLFESDENTLAASEMPQDGSLPLPSQQGIVQKAIEIQDQKYTPGEKPASQAGNPLPPRPPSASAQQQSAPVSTPAATPLQTPQPTPPSQPTNGVRLLQESEKSKPPAQNAPASQAMPPTVAQPGSAGSRKGYQPETRQTVIHGNISNKGRSSVAGEATPIGKYKKGLADAIGSRWYYYVNERMGLLSIGTVSVAFKVTSSGKVTGLHVVSSNSNESLTDCSLRSIMDAKFPPIPPEVAGTLKDGSMEIEYSFTIY